MKYDLTLYQTIIFDFDGVILDSETYKIQTFKSLFSSFPDYIDKIDEYNKANRGISRYDKFRYIYQNILQLPYTEEVEKKLGDEYSEKLSDNLSQIPLINGVKEFLSLQKVPLYIASSSKKAEMDIAMQPHDIQKYFKRVYDQTTTKLDAIRDVLRRSSLKNDQVLFIGDAIADYEAGHEAMVDFLARTDDPTKFPDGMRWIENFQLLI